MTNTNIIDTLQMVAMELNIQLDRIKVLENKGQTLSGDAMGTYTESTFKSNKTVTIEIVNSGTQEELIYVMAHELAHSKYKNHTKSHKDLTREYSKIVRNWI